uniref:Uncharacterized protein n=1 Tax=Arundo donax TaxID=35708 RepID=A0A0A8XVK2_ARUDO
MLLLESRTIAEFMCVVLELFHQIFLLCFHSICIAPFYVASH